MNVNQVFDISATAPDPSTTTIADALQRAQAESHSLLQIAQQLIVDGPSEAQEAADLRNEIRNRRKRIEDYFADLVSSAHKTWKELTTRRAAAVAQYDAPQRVLDGKLASYEAERQRLQREAAAAAERERQRQIEEHRLAAALEAEAAGRSDQAERILDGKAPEPVIIVPMAEQAPKVDGVAFQARYRGECVDLLELCRAVVAGQAAIELLQVNQVKLNALARALGTGFAVPGCRVVAETTVRKA